MHCMSFLDDDINSRKNICEVRVRTGGFDRRDYDEVDCESGGGATLHRTTTGSCFISPNWIFTYFIEHHMSCKLC
jgi:hypothetical protein